MFCLEYHPSPHDNVVASRAGFMCQSICSACISWASATCQATHLLLRTQRRTAHLDFVQCLSGTMTSRFYHLRKSSLNITAFWYFWSFVLFSGSSNKIIVDNITPVYFLNSNILKNTFFFFTVFCAPSVPQEDIVLILLMRRQRLRIVKRLLQGSNLIT